MMESLTGTTSKGGKKTAPSYRRGKWTAEEEAYSSRLITEFKLGLLPLTDGTTLRTFLSKLLNCDPMRISKKFVGQNCIGKQVFRRRQQDIDRLTPEELERKKKEIAELEKRFLERVAQTNRAQRNEQNGGLINKGGRLGSFIAEDGLAPPWMMPPAAEGGNAGSTLSHPESSAHSAVLHSTVVSSAHVVANANPQAPQIKTGGWNPLQQGSPSSFLGGDGSIGSSFGQVSSGGMGFSDLTPNVSAMPVSSSSSEWGYYPSSGQAAGSNFDYSCYYDQRGGQESNLAVSGLPTTEHQEAADDGTGSNVSGGMYRVTSLDLLRAALGDGYTTESRVLDIREHSLSHMKGGEGGDAESSVEQNGSTTMDSKSDNTKNSSDPSIPNRSKFRKGANLENRGSSGIHTTETSSNDGSVNSSSLSSGDRAVESFGGVGVVTGARSQVSKSSAGVVPLTQPHLDMHKKLYSFGRNDGDIDSHNDDSSVVDEAVGSFGAVGSLGVTSFSAATSAVVAAPSTTVGVKRNSSVENFWLLVNMGDLPKPDVNTLTESFSGDNSGGVAAARPPPENHESVLPPPSTRDHYAEYQQQMILQQYQMQMQMQGDPGLSAMYDNLSGPTPDLNQGHGQGQGTTQKRKAETHEDEPLHQRATDK